VARKEIAVKKYVVRLSEEERARLADFIRKGDAHPLGAIGIVATIIVFGSAMLVKEAWALL
jgi:hypothetical protein